MEKTLERAVSAGAMIGKGVPPWERQDLSGAVPMPTMLTPAEVRFLGWVGREWWRGEGEVVDLGCFLGGSTNAMLQGLRGNPAWGEAWRVGGQGLARRVKVYDSFITDGHAARAYDIGRREGESFRAVFDGLNEASLDEMDVREGWLPESVEGDAGERSLYPEQRPIEVMHIDIAKRWGVHRLLLRVFGRWLIPGRSMVVQQDFKHSYTFWIPLDMYMLRRCFEPTHDVPMSGSIGFVYRGGLEGALGGLPRTEEIGTAELERLWAEVESYWDAWGSREAAFMCGLQAARSFFTRGERERAMAWLSRTIERAERGEYDALAWLAFDDLNLTCATVLGTSDPKSGAATSAGAAIMARVGELRARFEECRRDRTAGVRASVETRLRCAGVRRWALYGAGRDATSLLSDGWRPGGTELVALLDDAPRRSELCGMRVIGPTDLKTPIDAVVVGSSAHRAAIAASARRVFDGTGVLVIDPYT